MPKVIVWRMADNTVAITAPSLTTNPQRAGETEDQWLERKAQNKIRKEPAFAAALSHFFVERAVTDTWYAAAAPALNGGKQARNAWRLPLPSTRVPVIDATALAALPVLPTRAVRDSAVDAETSFTATQRAALKRILNIAGTV